MNTNVESGADVMSSAVGESWRTMMWAGVVVAVLGVLAIFSPFVTGIALSIAIGALLVVGALVHVAHAFSGGVKNFAWQGLLAVIYAVGGIALLANPVVGLTTLTILLVAFLVVDGIVEIVMGVRMREERGGASMAVSGLLSLVIAGLIWVGYPASAAWALGLLFGVGLLTTGLSMIYIARGGRKTTREGVTPPETEPRGA